MKKRDTAVLICAVGAVLAGAISCTKDNPYKNPGNARITLFVVAEGDTGYDGLSAYVYDTAVVALDVFLPDLLDSVVIAVDSCLVPDTTVSITNVAGQHELTLNLAWPCTWRAAVRAYVNGRDEQDDTVIVSVTEEPGTNTAPALTVDSEDEVTEFGRLYLRNPVNAQIGPPDTLVGIIIDNDSLPANVWVVDAAASAGGSGRSWRSPLRMCSTFRPTTVSGRTASGGRPTTG
jgi:hypothetical protein